MEEQDPNLHALSDEEKWQYLTRHEKLGEVLVKYSRLTLEQLEKVLDEQKASGKHLGQLIVSHGLLTMDEILSALDLQHRNDKVSLESIIELQNKTKDA